MSLLKEIQDEAVTSQSDIASLLRKCRVLASRLKNDDLKNWVQNELDGYKPKDELPAYRICRCHSLGTFLGAGGRRLENAPIPLTSIPKEYRESLSKVQFRESISALADLVRHNDGKPLQQAWPPDLYPVVGEQIMQYMNLGQAWKVIPRSMIVSIIETVRNRILNFALELEAESPNAGESVPTAKQVSTEKVSQVFNTYIMGNVGNVATASSNFSQHGSVTVSQGDLLSLKTYLQSLGLVKADVSNLEKAIKEDGAVSCKPLGKRVSEWLGCMVTKAAQGLLNIGITVAPKLLTKALEQYYGIEDNE